MESVHFFSGWLSLPWQQWSFLICVERPCRLPASLGFASCGQEEVCPSATAPSTACLVDSQWHSMRAAWVPPGLREFAHGENEEMGEVIGEKKVDDSQAVVVEISADVDVENEKKHGDFPAAVCGTFLEFYPISRWFQ